MTGAPPDSLPTAERTLDALLDSLPSPHMPAGLAARIIRDVTRLPQIAAEPEEAAPEIRPERMPEPVTADIIPIAAAPSRRRWMAWAGGGLGTALAASLAMMMLLPHAPEPQAMPAASPALAPETAPAIAQAQPLPTVTPSAPVASSTAPRLASTATAAAPPALPSPGPAASPAAPATARGLPIPLPAIETAQVTPAPMAEVAPNMADVPDDTALPDTELAGSGNSRNGGPAPSQQGWGYSSGVTGSSAPQPDDGIDNRPERDRGRPGRRF